MLEHFGIERQNAIEYDLSQFGFEKMNWPVCCLITEALLLSRNASLWTPLDCAAAKGWVDAATVLLDEDCPVDPTDKAKVYVNKRHSRVSMHFFSHVLN